MLNELFSIKNKVAFVTGASSGLGRYFAVTLAKAGADVVIGAPESTLSTLYEVAEEIKTIGKKALVVVLDVTNSDLINEAVNTAINTMGKVDILVNNAGNLIKKPAIEYTEADWDSLIDTHLKGTWLMSQAVAKHMIARKQGGSIVNISSAAATRTVKNRAIYGIAKAGISRLTKSLAFEWIEHNIRVNAIAPGFFITDMTREFLASDAGKEATLKIPQQRAGEVQELAGPLLLLASDAGSYMTGSILEVDGGCVTNPF